MYKYLFISMVTMLSMASCSHFKMNGRQLSFDSVSFQDSVIFNAKSGVQIKLFSIYAINGNRKLQDSVNTWICEQLGDSTSQHINNIPHLLEIQGKKWTEEDSHEVREIMADAGEPEWGINYSRDIKIEKIFEDEEFVTLSNTTYTYCGGAHGGTYVGCTTFCKKDGHRMGWELLGDMDDESLRKALKDGLKAYFGITDNIRNEDGTISTPDEQLKDNLLEDSIVPPVTPPYLTKEGIQIIYQQYEIACYAAGMPSFTIKSKPKQQP